jgi:hypothetical protein
MDAQDVQEKQLCHVVRGQADGGKIGGFFVRNLLNVASPSVRAGIIAYG